MSYPISQSYQVKTLIYSVTYPNFGISLKIHLEQVAILCVILLYQRDICACQITFTLKASARVLPLRSSINKINAWNKIAGYFIFMRKFNLL